MSKVDELKENFNHFAGMLAVTGEIGDYKGFLDDFRYAIERVEELEEKNLQLVRENNQVNDELIEEYKRAERYKKALERIVYEDISGWSSQDILGKVIDIAHEALEGESE